MPVWSYADIWEQIADAQPDRPALIQGDRVLSWADFDHHANTLARAMLNASAPAQAKVATYLHNCPEYLTTTYAAFKAGLVPFNVNYRYGPEELYYLLDNADAEVVVFGAEFADKLEPLLSRLPRVRLWVAVDGEAPNWASAYDDIVGQPVFEPVKAPAGRSNDDQLIVYTGGTTGMPKGVMWRQEDLFGASKFYENPPLGIPPLGEPGDAVARLETTGRPVSLIASPLMHATGLMGAVASLVSGGAAAFLPSRKFDAVELLDEAERVGAARISIVGMAFAGPILEALDANPGRWKLPKLRAIGSSGAMWSIENKRGLLKHLPHITISDSFASSEAFGMGLSLMTKDGEYQTAKFDIGETCAVFTEDGRRVEPGSGQSGRTAVGGYIPLGYYKDPDKTARTFPVIEGQRWSMPGDWARVEADGSLTLLGRGSQCINTGGEKVYPEEVEEALKRNDAVRDAAVVGLPDPRFGETIAALVELKPGARSDTETLRDWVKGQLADYKAPRQVLFVDSVNRAPNGKLDYKALKALAAEQLQPQETA